MRTVVRVVVTPEEMMFANAPPVADLLYTSDCGDMRELDVPLQLMGPQELELLVTLGSAQEVLRALMDKTQDSNSATHNVWNYLIAQGVCTDFQRNRILAAAWERLTPPDA